VVHRQWCRRNHRRGSAQLLQEPGPALGVDGAARMIARESGLGLIQGTAAQLLVAQSGPTLDDPI